MQSKAATVEQYLAELPEDRRAALSAVRNVILKNLDKDYEECMGYGMMGYCVPHRVYPAGYHCDPTKPLPFVGLASQKGYMSLYLMCYYGDKAYRAWFDKEWKKSGKKLDMGKSCIRFKSADDLPLDLIGEAIRRVPAKKYIAVTEALLESRGKGGSKTAKPKAAAAKRAPAAKKVSKKKTGKKVVRKAAR